MTPAAPPDRAPRRVAGSAYLNFAEEPTDTRAAYSGEAYERLQAIKARYDAGDVFRANHPIAPAS